MTQPLSSPYFTKKFRTIIINTNATVHSDLAKRVLSLSHKIIQVTILPLINKSNRIAMKGRSSVAVYVFSALFNPKKGTQK